MTLACFWVPGCSVVIDKQRSPLFTVWRGLHTLTANKPPIWSHIPPDMCRKICKIQLCLLCCMGCRGEGSIWFNFRFEIFYLGSEILVADLKVMGFTAKRLKFGMCNQILHLFAEYFLKVLNKFYTQHERLWMLRLETVVHVFELLSWDRSKCNWFNL